MGPARIKIDYLSSDSQARFQFRDVAVQDCLKHKLLVGFHGKTCPRGQERRWPNLITREGIHGAGYYMAWSEQPNTPAHNCTVLFTRNVVGSMDYTPVTFSTLRRNTTDAHELALAVVFESGWQCISDSPEVYRAHPGRPILKEVPAAWDDLHFLAGWPGEYVCLARRKGHDWFVAGLNVGTARTLSIPLGFLKPGKYAVRLYRDDAAEGCPAIEPLYKTKLLVEDRTVETATPLKIYLPANGGFATKFPGSR